MEVTTEFYFICEKCSSELEASQDKYSHENIEVKNCKECTGEYENQIEQLEKQVNDLEEQIEDLKGEAQSRL